MYGVPWTVEPPMLMALRGILLTAAVYGALGFMLLLGLFIVLGLVAWRRG